jgi:hypothetical protein
MPIDAIMCEGLYSLTRHRIMNRSHSLKGMTNGKGSHPSMNGWFPYGLHVIRCQTSQLSLDFGHHVIPIEVLILQTYHTLLQLMRS